MNRHLKLFFVLLLVFNYDLYSDKLAKVYFQSNSKYLSLNNDGYNDTIVFTIKFDQNKEIFIKKFRLEILDSHNSVLQSLEKNINFFDHNQFIFIWDGKNQRGDLVSEGEYKAVLKVFYNYANIIKEYEISFFAIRENYNFEMKFLNPIIIIQYDKIQNKRLNQSEMKILQKYDQIPLLNTESFILDHNKNILESKIWIQKIKDIILWNGVAKDSTVETLIYHYLFKFINKEGIENNFILPGILVIPHHLEYYSFLNHYILNRKGFGFENNSFQSILLNVKNKELKDVQFKNNSDFLSKYFQIYCYKSSFISSEWKYYKDGIEDISEVGILKVINFLPENENCLIIFYKNPISEFDFLKLNSNKIFTIIPIYLDTKIPELKLDFYSSFRPNSLLYENFYQKLNLEISDNTFIESINIKIYISYKDSLHWIKEWNIPYFKIPQYKKNIQNVIFWYGEMKENLLLYSLENFLLEIQIRDYAGNLLEVKKNFKTDIFFREKNNNFITYIPLSNFFDSKSQIISYDYLDVVIEEFKKRKKNYIYIYTYLFEKDPFEDLKKSEQLSEQIYDYIIKKIPKEKVFYRGWGNLIPIYNSKDKFYIYKNNRIEIIFSDELNEREKL